MLHVNGGVGDTSYANNSLLQRRVISMTWPVTKEAISDLCAKFFPTTTLVIADLGCSSGPNSLIMVSNIVKQLEEFRRINLCEKPPLEYHILLNDLHGNDFNSIFRSIPSLLKNLKIEIGNDFGPCFFNGVPGSFYHRLFPYQSIHFFHSSSSLHWLSQVPEGIENNKGNIFMSKTSPKNVIEAFKNQFQKDFSNFLKCRAQELVIGGNMVLTMLGRTNEDPRIEGSTSFWELLASTLNTMVHEGLVEEKNVDCFNIPTYMASTKEVEIEVLKEGSFSINDLQLSKIDWNLCDEESNTSNNNNNIDHDFAGCVRSVIESLLIPHFGEHIMDELFSRYKAIIVDKTSKNKLELINLTVSLVKTK